MRYFSRTVAAVAGLLLAAGTTVAAAPANNHPFAASFARADKNKDGFLDEAELAVEFRGPNAKPITDAPGGRETHPDHAFMDRWDANNDHKISKAEFDKYEQAAVSAAKAAAARMKNYTRGGSRYGRGPMRHRGYARHGGRSNNPFAAIARYQQRAYLMQRAAFMNMMRYGAYNRNGRGGFRGAMMHHGRRR